MGKWIHELEFVEKASAGDKMGSFLNIHGI